MSQRRPPRITPYATRPPARIRKADNIGLATPRRIHETKGLIRSSRSSGNQRRYARDVLRRIAIIRVAQQAGIPLATILVAVQSLPADGAPSRQDWRRLSTAWRAELNNRIVKLTELRDRLDDCIGCGCLSTKVCPLRNPSDRLAAGGAFLLSGVESQGR